VPTGPPASEPAIAARLRAAGSVFAEEEARLLVGAARTPADLDRMVDERVAGVPVEQLVGWVTFCGLRILVDRGVFVPRRRTELLVREAVGLARRVDGPVVVDLCCGSGAVAAAIAAALPSVELHAVDLDPAATRCARRNLACAGASVYEGDLDAPLPATLAGRVDVLVANAPYVPSGEIGMLPREARVHEPRTALDGGTDGLDVLRRLAAAALRWLAPGGHVLVETGQRQAEQVAVIFARHRLRPRVSRDDEVDATVVVGLREGVRADELQPAPESLPVRGKAGNRPCAG
jgi:release factor glutamine methyltransferase